MQKIESAFSVSLEMPIEQGLLLGFKGIIVMSLDPFHFIFRYLRLVAPPIYIDCFAGAVQKNTVTKLKPNLQSFKQKYTNLINVHKKDTINPLQFFFSLLLKVRREGASLTSELNWFQILGPRNEKDFCPFDV